MAKREAASVSYERLVRDVFQALANQRAVATVVVRHDVEVTGRAGKKRQVDVFWEFEIAGERYRTVIECKHYNRNVPGDVVDKMVSVLSDLGPGTTGIIVTTVGFQPLARAIAAANGIRLLKVNPLLRHIEIAMHVGSTDFVNIRPTLDPASANAALDRAGQASFRFESVGRGPALVTGGGEPIGMMADALARTANGAPGHHAYAPDDAFAMTPIGPIRLLRVEFDAEVSWHEELILVDFPAAARAIIEDVLANTRSYLHVDGTVRP